MMLQDYVFRIVVAEYTEPVLNKDGKPTNRVKQRTCIQAMSLLK